MEEFMVKKDEKGEMEDKMQIFLVSIFLCSLFWGWFQVSLGQCLFF